MFTSQDPNHDLQIQQSVFGSRTAPKPTIKEKLSRFFSAEKEIPKTVQREQKEPMAELIRNCLLNDIPEIAAKYPILSNPEKEDKLPESFIVLQLVDDDPNAVQIELFMSEVIEARYELLTITSKLERMQSPQIAEAGLVLKSDRMIVHKPTLPGRPCAVCRIMPGKLTNFTR